MRKLLLASLLGLLCPIPTHPEQGMRGSIVVR